MKLSLCNEVLRDLSFSEQCTYAAKLGYEGLEVAPFTLSQDPQNLSASERRAIVKSAKDAGIAISGLHWLLVTPAGLSLNGADEAIRNKTVTVMEDLVDLCADLGGDVLVHGSPVQRSVQEGESHDTAWSRARDAWAIVAERAEKSGVTYCIEALSTVETNFITNIESAARMVKEIGSPNLRTMIDTSAAGQTETKSNAALIEKYLPSGIIDHVQVNDRNRRGPGQGEDTFTEFLGTLKRLDYKKWIAVEPFNYDPDGPSTAAFAAGYLKGILEALK